MLQQNEWCEQNRHRHRHKWFNSTSNTKHSQIEILSGNECLAEKATVIKTKPSVYYLLGGIYKYAL